MKQLAAVIPSTRRFVSAYWWIVGDHLPKHKARLTLVVVLSAIGALAQAGTIAFIAFAVDYLEDPANGSAELLRMLGRAGEPPGTWLHRATSDRTAMLAYFGAGLLLLVLAGAWASYAAIIRTRALGRLFHSKLSKRTLSTLAVTSTVEHPEMPDQRGRFKRLVMRDSIFLGKAVETILRSFEPVLRMLVLAALLFSIEWRLSLAILPFFLILMPTIYSLGRGVKRDSLKFYEGTLVAMHGRVLSLMTMIDRLALPVGSPVGRIDEIFDADPQISQYFDEFDRIQLAHERVQVAIASVGSLMIVGALLAGGYLAQQQSLTWGLVLAYMMGLQQTLVSFRVVMSHLASLTLYFPSAERHIRFWEERPATSGTEPTPGPVSRIELVAGDGALPGSEPSAILEPGAPHFYVCDWQIGRLNLKQVLRPLVESGSIGWEALDARASFVGPKASLPPGSARSRLIGDDADDRRQARVLEWLELLGVREELESLPGGLEADLGGGIQEGLSEALKMALFVLPGVGDRSSVLLLDMWLLHKAGRQPARSMLELLDDRIVLLCTSGLTLSGALGDRVIVSQGERVTGIGSLDWFDGVKGELKPSGQPASAAVDEEDDFDI